MSPSSFDSDALLAEVGWVQALARQLVPDHHQADDLVQETLVAAIQALERERPLSLRAWLRGILRNVSSASGRKERHRRDREDASRHEAETQSTLELIERASVQRNLVSVLLELEEPYRATLLLKYFEGLSNDGIAERLGVSASTVATHAARGLERMRERLRGRFGGDEGNWMAALLPLRNWAQRTAKPVLGGSSTALLMSTQIKVLVSLGAVVGAFFIVRGGAHDDQLARAALPEPAIEAPAELALPERDVSPAVSGIAKRQLVETHVATDASGEATTQVPGRSVRGHVLDLSGRPVANVEVVAGKKVLVRDGDGRLGGTMVRAKDPSIFARVRTMNDGSFEFNVTESVGTVIVRDARYVTIVASGLTGDATELVVIADWRLPLAGIVTDEAGVPVGDAVLHIGRPDELLSVLAVVLDRAAILDMTANSAGDGSFSFENAAEIPHGALVVTAPGYSPWYGGLPAGGDEHMHIALKSESRLKLLTGRVFEPSGSPVDGAHVSFGALAVSTDAEGRFSLDPAHPAARSLPQDDPLVLRAFFDGFAPAEQVLPSPNEGNERGWPAAELILGARDQMPAIRGRVVDQDGEPMSSVTVHLLDKTRFGQLPDGRSGQSYVGVNVESLIHGQDPHADTNERGEFVIDGLLGRAYRLQAIEEGSMISVTTEPIAAGSSDVVIRVDRTQLGVIAGRLLDLDGNPIPNVSISVSCSVAGMGLAFGSRGTSDEDGSFRLEGTSTKGVSLSLSGEAIVPELEYALPEDADLERLELIVGRRCHVQFAWASRQQQGLALYAVDPHDQEIQLVQIREGMWSVMFMAFVTGELSEVFVLPDTTAAVVLKRNGVEVERIPIELTPGDVQRIDI